MRARALTVCIVVSFVLAACGGGGSVAWSQSEKDAAVGRCVRNAAASHSKCVCVVNWIASRYSVDDEKKLENSHSQKGIEIGRKVAKVCA